MPKKSTRRKSASPNHTKIPPLKTPDIPPDLELQKQQLERQIEFGYSVGKIITSVWNSQSNPGKVYLFGRRIHHGEIGFIGAILCAIALSPTGMGLFKALMDDDIHDKDEWFKFEKETPR